MADFSLVGRMIMFAGIFAAFLVLLTGQAAEYNPDIQEMTGYTPASETPACQGFQLENQGKIIYDNETQWTSGTEYSDFGNIKTIDDVNTSNGTLKLDDTATEGSWVEALVFDANVAITGLTLDVDYASSNEPVEVRINSGNDLILDYDTVETIQGSGTTSIDVDRTINTNSIFPNDKFRIWLKLTRNQTSDPSPRVDSLTVESTEASQGFSSQVFQSGRCTLNQVNSYISILYANTGNAYVNIILNVVGLLLIISLLLLIREVLSIVPFLG